MQLFQRKRTGRLPDNTPGPSPWYLCRRGTEIHSNRGLLVWRSAGERDSRAGKTVLTTDTREALLILNFYWYVQPLPGDRILLWRLQRSEDIVSPPRIRFLILEVSALLPFSDVGGGCERMKKTGSSIYFDGELFSERVMPAALPAGDYSFAFPEAFSNIDELLVLSAPELDQLSLWILNPRIGIVSVFPQDWWNNSKVDFGYQWVTRVARDRGTRKIIGEGIRVSPFVLDAGYRNLETS